MDTDCGGAGGQRLKRTMTDVQGPCLVSTNPATQEVVGTVVIASPEQVDTTIASARSAQAAWWELGYRERARRLRAWKAAIVRDREALARLLTQENGKTLSDAFSEWFSVCEFLEHYARHSERLLRDRHLRGGNWLLASRKTYLQYRPKGVIGVIAPWNYPVLLAIADIAPALASGNTVVFKPSELTPLVSQALVRLGHQSGIPEEVLAIVTGDRTTGEALTNGAIDHLCFTGSVATGRAVGIASATRLRSATLELGGKDPALVLDDVNIPLAARGIVWGAFANTGQVCASIERLYVSARIAEPFMSELIKQSAALVVGDGLEPASQVGPLINEAQLERVDAQVKDAVANGASILLGGHRLDRPGCFYAPTILAGVTPDLRVMQEETFGPLLPVVVCESESEMIQAANASNFGLSASIWTPDLARAERIAGQLQAGTIWVNTGLASYGNPLLPRGGIKESGIGKSGGEAGLMEMVNTRLIEVSGQRVGKLWWFPLLPNASQIFSTLLGVVHGTGVRSRFKEICAFIRNQAFPLS
jgi:succinate-semialdehyde dehydrogenase/glutarate-semialdehyde dehydrogenase